MRWTYDTGGREKYYKKLTVGDCVVRAIAIANNMDYKETYKLVKKYNSGFTPRNGVYKLVAHNVLTALGWQYIPCCGRGHTGELIHMREEELPDAERIICNMDRHIAAVIDGKLHDTYDCSKQGNRQIYGYWVKEVDEELLKLIEIIDMDQVNKEIHAFL